ncbi:isochorismatase family protein [Microbacteriaceae bacterium K1510]|nr:isochorismatase family protein [Microbacteriaceae bacterium K1510]
MRDFEDYCWRDLLSPDMVKIYSAYHRQRGLTSRPALVVIHPPSDFDTIGEEWCRAVRDLSEIIRARALPVVHSVRPNENCDPRLGALPDELICRRTTESAFLLSDLEAHLTRARANGVILCGAPMSGALRATAVEAKSFGYKTAVAEDATGDESSLLRKMALFDVAHKYADVMTAQEIISVLAHELVAGAA